MIADLFLRQIPVVLQEGIRSGQFDVYGSTIRRVANGQIVGFLQETSGLSKIAGLVGSGPVAPLKLIGTGIQIVQGEQIKHGLSVVQQGVAMLNHLQVANLALSAAGIGVSAIGFAVINSKIDGVQREIRALGAKLDQLLEEVRGIDMRLVGDRVKQLHGLARSVDHNWSNSDEGARAGWRDDAGEARQLHDFFEGRAEQVLSERPTAAGEATPLLDASALASGLRVASLALSGETTTAINVANDNAERLARLTGSIGAADLTRA